MIVAMGLSCGAGSCTSKPSSGQQATENDSLKNTVIASTQAVTTAATPKKLSYEKKGMFVENDTTFLYRYAKLDTFNNHVSYDYTDAYIETNRESKDWQTVKQWWSNFIYNEYDQDSYNKWLEYLHKEFGTPLPTHNCDEIKTTWVPFLSWKILCRVPWCLLQYLHQRLPLCTHRYGRTLSLLHPVCRENQPDTFPATVGKPVRENGTKRPLHHRSGTQDSHLLLCRPRKREQTIQLFANAQRISRTTRPDYMAKYIRARHISRRFRRDECRLPFTELSKTTSR